MTDAPERIWADFVKWVKISGVYEQNGTWFGAAGRGTEYIRADLVDAQDAAWAERVAALEAAVAAARAEGMREALELNTAHSKLWRALGDILECPGISPNATVRRMARIAEKALIEDKFSVVKPTPKFTAEAQQ